MTICQNLFIHGLEIILIWIVIYGFIDQYEKTYFARVFFVFEFYKCTEY